MSGRSGSKSIAGAICIACASWAFSSCGTSTCGLQLVQHLYLPAPDLTDPRKPQQKDTQVPCCSGFAYQDIDLTTAGDIEVDLSNPSPAGSGVDGFLTAGGCTKLFDAPYPGSAGSPLCTVYIGPIAPRLVSARRKVAAGRYRLFAQAYITNQDTVATSLDLGVWSTKCRWNPIAQ